MQKTPEQPSGKISEEGRAGLEYKLRKVEENILALKEQINMTAPGAKDKAELARLIDELAGEEAARDSLKKTLERGEPDPN